MRKNSKGFTLIELLAVIVILAIIALIATPVILNLIEKARIGAAQDSAYQLRKAAQLYYMTSIEEDPDFAGATFTCGEKNDAGYACKTDGDVYLEVDGTNPTTGTITVTATGTITFDKIRYNNAYNCFSDKDGTKEMSSVGTIYCKKGDVRS